MSSRSRGQKICFFIFTLVFLGASAWAQSIPNPSFETDTDYTYPGYRSTITGWTLSGGGGLNQAGQPFADNGAVPNGVRVAFLQSVAKLSTTITGLTAGKAYRVSFRANARAGNSALGQCALNGQPAVGFTSSPSVGGSNPYYSVQQTFLATGATALLEISQTRSGDTTLLVDDFSIAPEPPQISVSAEGQVIAWGPNFDGQTDVPAEAQSGVVSVAAGTSFSVALKTSGRVVAWGRNDYGQTTVPAAAQSGVIAIAAAGNHTVALKADGSVVAWGENSYGLTPVPAAAQSGVIAVAAGLFHTVALKADGSVIAWGNNSNGETTVPQAAQSGAVALAAGGFHTAVLNTDGSLIVWGESYYGSVPVDGQSGVMACAAGQYHTIGLKGDGRVFAWGDNGWGQSTVPPAALSGVIAIATGHLHNLALKADGSVVAWGSNFHGNTNVPFAALSRVIAIAAGSISMSVKELYAFDPRLVGTTSAAKTYTIRNTGTTPLSLNGVSVMGRDATDFTVNTNGILNPIPIGGWTTLTVTFTPGALGSRQGTLRVLNNSLSRPTADVSLTGTGLSPRISVDPTTAFNSQDVGSTSAPKTYTIRNTGNLPLIISSISVTGGNAPEFAMNTNGMLNPIPANGSTTLTVTFSPSTGGSRQSVLRILNNSQNLPTLDVALTGTGLASLIGVDLTTPFDPQAVGSTSDPKIYMLRNTGNTTLNISSVSITGGNETNFAVNTNDMLTSVPAGGSTTLTVSFTPGARGPRQSTLRVVNSSQNLPTNDIVLNGAGLIPWIVVSGDGGGLLAWGNEPNGQADIPTMGQSAVVGIAAGYEHTVTLKANGSVLAWGNNNNGQSEAPVAAQSGVIAVAAGPQHTVALKADGSILAWGMNDVGQTDVPVAEQGAIAIAAGALQTLALRTDGSVITWGNNGYGLLDVPMAAQSGVVGIAAGYRHSVALGTNGTVIAWGDDAYGQTTVPVAAQSGIVAVAAGLFHNVALKSDGSVLAWGFNGYGQTNVPTAAQSGVIAVAAGHHSVALKADGSIIAWGLEYGEATTLVETKSGVIAIAASLNHTVALKAPNSFDPQPVGSTSASRTYTIHNVGGAPLTITNASVTGGNAADFAVNTNGMLNPLPAGASTTLTVTFSPSAIGSRQSTLRILNNSENFPTNDVALSGIGLPSPGVADFVTRPNGAAVQINVATLLANDLGSSLGITAVSATSAAGGQIEFGNGIIIYNPPASHYNIASDTFTYTVTNDSPATATATVTVTVVGNPSRSLTTSSPGVVRFNALPNTTYQLQYTGNIDAGFAWTNLLLLTTGSNGSASHDDGSTDPVRFYRIVVP